MDAQKVQEPTFEIYKYQHVVGKEMDECTREDEKTKCHARFSAGFHRVLNFA
jgi:hypothetical protein